ncbi:universal stress protein [Devosia nitrariae]|uniref:Universal stress protein UspA n=1 Tax=Devosia nitrariae TaxID=2071872 RepID=A0ABQ5WA80_9HYPH|nr:universal stress protein [Devosia nitrariae]GLQ56633.1 universal stress protein UspA [Devosia nitrariae]
MIKDVIVYLTGSSADEERMAHALAVTAQFDAHLTGLHAHALPQLTVATDASLAAEVQQVIVESTQRADAVHAILERQFAVLAIPNDLRRIDAYPGALGRAVASEARTADLFIGSRPYNNANDEERLEEVVLFGSGRASFLAPPAHRAPDRYERVLVAWKNTRESARAVAEAMPFLRSAGEVIVAVVEEDGASEERGMQPHGDIGRHLSRHGVKAEVRVIDGWTRSGDAILNEAGRSGAQLVVMGGYGHSRLRQWLLGGVTRQLLSEAQVPILIAH